MSERASGLMGRGNVEERAGKPGNSIIHCGFIGDFVILWGDETVLDRLNDGDCA